MPSTEANVAVELSAVIVGATPADAHVLTVAAGGDPRPALPAGKLVRGHRTLELGLRAWVAEQAHLRLGYVEQLYTFGDEGRMADRDRRRLSVGYLALVRETGGAGELKGAWRSWYEFFPWEDWRAGAPRIVANIRARVGGWVRAAKAPAERRQRRLRATQAFGADDGAWNDERVLERYELLYEIGFVAEAHGHGPKAAGPTAGGLAAAGAAMTADHRRILATAIARLRGKIKYRPLVFELMPPSFTFLQLQQTVEALAGLRLHKPNFRRLVEQQGLVEPTGATAMATGGRPAKLWRFRTELLEERAMPGVKLPRTAG
jgi:hypothetical protein